MTEQMYYFRPMTNGRIICVLLMCMLSTGIRAQYLFSGQVNEQDWKGTVYLSVIDDYRKTSGVFTDQILATAALDSLGKFSFSGPALEKDYRFYRIHVDACEENQLDMNHFTGHCETSKEVVFLAKSSDTIEFPMSFEAQMFCSVMASNPAALKLQKVDSLKEVMRYEFAGFRSKAKHEATLKQWFEKFHEFGKDQNEPLVELYIHSFLTDRGSTFYDYFTQDLAQNSYYDNLVTRLEDNYPDSPYTAQYISELKGQKFSLGLATESRPKWHYYLFAFVLIGLLVNALYWNLKKRKKKTTQPVHSLTAQENKILGLILENKTNKEIAAQIFVSHSTVKTHINNLYRKLGVTSRDQLKSLYNK